MTNSNNLQHISVGLDEVLTDLLVRCMLNPNNKDFYIGTLTLDRVKQYFAEMPQEDISVASVFWSAYHIAETEYLKQQKEASEEEETFVDALIDFFEEHPTPHKCCPECGCPTALGYISGIKCPNCDYEGEE